jgi:bacterial/archaeal transporter family protein
MAASLASRNMKHLTAQKPRAESAPSVRRAVWLRYAMLAILGWGGYAICAKLGSREIPAASMQVLFTFGALPVAAALLIARRFRIEKSPAGLFYGITKGILSGIGGIAMFAAYRAGGNTAVIASASSMYPIVTVVLALLILRERLTWWQVVGLGFAVLAFLAFS